MNVSKVLERKKYFQYIYIFLVLITILLPLFYVHATSVGTNVSVTGTLTVTDTSTFTGAATFNGAATLNGNVTIGNLATADTLTVTARLASNLIPNANNTIDLGAFGLAFASIYASSTIYGSNLVGTSATATSTFPNIYTKDPIADVRSFGATGDGVTDDTTAVQAALNASLNVYIPSGVFIVSNLATRNSQRIFGNGSSSILQFKTGSTGYMFENSTYSVRFDNLDLDGGTNTDQSGTTSAGTRSGIHVSALLPNNSITNVSVHGFSNIGIGFNGTGSLVGYPGAPTITGVNVYYNYVGIDTGVGGEVGLTTTGEYLKLSDITAYNNRIGLRVNSGNNSITGSHFDTNGYGIIITDAYNNAHGTIVGSTINHNTVLGLFTSSTSNGFTITGNQIWYSNVLIATSTGITMTNNSFVADVITLNAGGTNLMKDNWFGTGNTVNRNGDNFIMADNYQTNGTYNQNLQSLLVENNVVSYSTTTDILNTTGLLNVGTMPTQPYPPSGINVYGPNTFSGTSYGGSTPNSVNLAITTSDVGAKDVGGVLGLGGKYQTGTPTYPQIIFGALKGGKSNVTSGNFDGYLGIYTNKGASLTERARFTEDGNVGIATTTPRSLLQVSGASGATTSTIWVGDLSGNVGQLCMGRAGGVGASCIFFDSAGVLTTVATSTY